MSAGLHGMLPPTPAASRHYAHPSTHLMCPLSVLSLENWGGIPKPCSTGKRASYDDWFASDKILTRTTGDLSITETQGRVE